MSGLLQKDNTNLERQIAQLTGFLPSVKFTASKANKPE